MKITPQIFRTYSGQRLLTYAIFYNGKFCAYSRCFCEAVRAVEMIREGMKCRSQTSITYSANRLRLHQWREKITCHRDRELPIRRHRKEQRRKLSERVYCAGSE